MEEALSVVRGSPADVAGITEVARRQLKSGRTGVDLREFETSPSAVAHSMRGRYVWTVAREGNEIVGYATAQVASRFAILHAVRVTPTGGDTSAMKVALIQPLLTQPLYGKDQWYLDVDPSTQAWFEDKAGVPSGGRYRPFDAHLTLIRLLRIGDDQ